MKTFIIIAVVIVLLVAGILFGYYQYKTMLVDKLLYNCQTGCDAKRKYLMGQSINTLKNMISGVVNFNENVDLSQLMP